MDFLVNNYLWIIIGAVMVALAIIGYFAEKTDFASKKIENDKKESTGEEQTLPNVVVDVPIDVKSGLSDNLSNSTQNMSDEGQLPNDNSTLEATIDGVPAELFAPLNPTDTINIDNVSPNVDLNENVEPINLPSDESNVKVSDADGVNFDDLYKENEQADNIELNKEEVVSNKDEYENMETSDSEITPIEEEVSSDPLFAANVAPLSVDLDEEKEQQEPWAEESIESSEKSESKHLDSEEMVNESEDSIEPVQEPEQITEPNDSPVTGNTQFEQGLPGDQVIINDDSKASGTEEDVWKF